MPGRSGQPPRLLWCLCCLGGSSAMLVRRAGPCSSEPPAAGRVTVAHSPFPCLIQLSPYLPLPVFSVQRSPVWRGQPGPALPS